MFELCCILSADDDKIAQLEKTTEQLVKEIKWLKRHLKIREQAIAAKQDITTMTKQKKMNTIEYILPASWASYLINGDGSGLVDSEMTEICDFIEREQLGGCVSCSDESWFVSRNDSGNGLAGDVMEFSFSVKA